MSIRLIKILNTALLTLIFSGCAAVSGSAPLFYSADPIEGRVIDYETGKPIEGAIVVAQWILESTGEYPRGHWIVSEQTTDSDGRYLIAGWPPKVRPSSRCLMNEDPSITIFKAGYWPEIFTNQQPGSGSLTGINDPGDSTRRSFWNGRDIRLVPFRIGEEITKEKMRYPDNNPAFYSDNDDSILMSEEKWADQISGIQTSVAWDINTMWPKGKRSPWAKEQWLQIRKLVQTINEECLKLRPTVRKGYLSPVPEQFHKLLLGNAPKCP